MRRTDCFFLNNSRLEASRLDLNISKPSDGSSFLKGKASLGSIRAKEMNHTFKVPNFESLPRQRTALKKVASPIRRLQTTRAKNELKLSQQSKMNFRPSTSFLNASRRSLHSNARNNQSRKELIKKMVYLAEYALKNKEENKSATPIKPVATFTPRGTPRVRGYLVLPEFSKKGPNVEELRTPLKNFIRKETSVRKTPAMAKNNSFDNTLNNLETLNESYSGEISRDTTTTAETASPVLPVFPEIKINSTDNETGESKEILKHFQSYNRRITEVLEKLQIVENCFEETVRNLPEHLIYDEFCRYQAEKQKLNLKMKDLDEELTNTLKNDIDRKEKLNDYFKENRQLFEKQMKLHKEFESVVETEAFKVLTTEKDVKSIEKTKVSVDVAKPTLRRSLRLSKLPKKEVTPMGKKLIRLNAMSKGIQKTKKSPCGRKGKVLRL